MIIAEFVGGPIDGAVRNMSAGVGVFYVETPQIPAGVAEPGTYVPPRTIKHAYHRHRFKINRWIFIHESIRDYLTAE
jgi:hypothetical protein